MKTNLLKKQKVLFTLLPALLASLPSFADHNSAAVKSQQRLFELNLEQLLNVKVSVGSRGVEREANLSPTPIDVVTSAELLRSGHTELGPALRSILASFNYQNFSLRDGSDHSPPFALRGMSSDQVLVLINGKRYHPSALTHLSTALARGDNNVDINTIPMGAIEQIEILKDGAAAQYGSDAISGIMNIKLKKTVSNAVSLHSGLTTEGDGEFLALELQHHFAKDDAHYLQVTTGFRHSNKTVRGGPDRRQQYFDGDPRNDLAETQNQVRIEDGTAQRSDLFLTLNGEYRLTADNLLADSVVYGFANINYRQGDSSVFNRRALDDRTIRSIYPDGYLPRIEPEILDTSVSFGVKSNTNDSLNNTETDNSNDYNSDSNKESWSWDLSNTLGKNSFHYFVTNSANVSMGLDSPTSFDAGQLSFLQNTVNLDFSKSQIQWLSTPTKVSFGAELRYRAYQIEAGEPASYQHGGVPILDGPNAGNIAPAGSQGFSGFTPQNAKDKSSNSYALYADVELNLSNDWLLQLASRFEKHQDFGSNTDFKIATNYQFDPHWQLKMGASTGFRAPSLAQQHFTSTAVAFIDETLTEVGTYSIDAPVAQSLGAEKLNPEQSEHLNLGLHFNLDNHWSSALDLFHIKIKDRIELTGNITQNADIFGQQVVDILQSYNISGARFFTNALDTQTSGGDFELRFNTTFDNGISYSAKANYHYNQTKIIGPAKTPLILIAGNDVIFDRGQRNRLTARSPNKTFFLSNHFQADNWQLNVKALRYGSSNLIFSNNNPQLDQKLSAKWLIDLDLNYDISRQLDVSFGVQNLFDTYPDYTDTQPNNPFFGEGNIFEYSDSSPFGYNGRSVYLRLNYIL